MSCSSPLSQIVSTAPLSGKYKLMTLFIVLKLCGVLSCCEVIFVLYMFYIIIVGVRAGFCVCTVLRVLCGLLRVILLCKGVILGEVLCPRILCRERCL